MFIFLLFIIIVLFVIGMIRSGKPTIGSHWHHLVQGLQTSVEDFYESVDKLIGARKVPDVKVWVENYHEGGIITAKRLYLLVGRKDHVFYICAAPFGNGFFISWWLGEKLSEFVMIVNNIPWIGPPLIRMFHPETFYTIDTALMFQDSIHSAVIEVLDERMKGQGLRLLSELERKPIMRELFKKKI